MYEQGTVNLGEISTNIHSPTITKKLGEKTLLGASLIGDRRITEVITREEDGEIAIVIAKSLNFVSGSAEETRLSAEEAIADLRSNNHYIH